MYIEDFNLLISTARGNEAEACSEAWFLLGEVGDREALVDRTEVTGLVVAKTKLDPFEAIRGLRNILKERPEEFRYILKVIPIEVVTRTSLERIRDAVRRLAPKIREGETFRVTVEKRHTELPTMEIIKAAASDIDRKVNLENPDKIVLIEVLGRLTGISIIEPDDILSVVKERH
ncbi:RNA methyltransferase [Candidatus Bathyarchaeota archaeon]|nr:MAG: RNA methyltransferase [Candidatus Bathyarchaeota archaeon]